MAPHWLEIGQVGNHYGVSFRYVDKVGFAWQGQEKGLRNGPAGGPAGLAKRFCQGSAVLKHLAGARIRNETPTILFKKIKNKFVGGDICARRGKHGIAPSLSLSLPIFYTFLSFQTFQVFCNLGLLSLGYFLQLRSSVFRSFVVQAFCNQDFCSKTTHWCLAQLMSVCLLTYKLIY